MKKFGFSIRAMLIAAILLPEIAFTHIAGQEEVSRTAFMLQASGQMLVSVVAFALCMQARRFAHATDNRLGIPRLDVWLRVLLAAYVVDVFVCALVGFARGFDIGFVVGDFYKFLAFPSFFYVIYTGLSSPRIVNTSVKYVFWIQLLAGAGFVAYYAILHQVHIRPVAIYLTTWLPSLLYCQYRSGLISKNNCVLLVPFVLVSYAVISWGSQSLTYVAIGMMVFVGTVYLYNRKRFGWLGMSVVVLLLVAAGISLLLDADFVDQSVSTVADPNFYLTRKLHFLLSDGMSLQTVELMGGDRLAQLVSVIRHWIDNPLDALCGQGMGGQIAVSSVTGLSNTSWKDLNHYLEAGYPQVMLRTGIIGMALYVGFLMRFLRMAIAGSTENPFLAMGAAYLLYISIFSIFNEALLGMGMGSLFMICYVCAMTARDFRQGQARQHAAQVEEFSRRSGSHQEPGGRLAPAH